MSGVMLRLELGEGDMERARGGGGSESMVGGGQSHGKVWRGQRTRAWGPGGVSSLAWPSQTGEWGRGGGGVGALVIRLRVMGSLDLPGVFLSLSLSLSGSSSSSPVFSFPLLICPLILQLFSCHDHVWQR